jgi:hypothetical protein
MAERDPEPRARDDREEREDEERAREPELLADHREEKVGVRLRQVEHLLPALAEPDTPEPARPERDERLLQLEVDAERVTSGFRKATTPRQRYGAVHIM